MFFPVNRSLPNIFFPSWNLILYFSFKDNKREPTRFCMWPMHSAFTISTFSYSLDLHTSWHVLVSPPPIYLYILIFFYLSDRLNILIIPAASIDFVLPLWLIGHLYVVFQSKLELSFLCSHKLQEWQYLVNTSVSITFRPDIKVHMPFREANPLRPHAASQLTFILAIASLLKLSPRVCCPISSAD